MQSPAVVFLVATVVGPTLAFDFGESYLDELIANEAHATSAVVDGARFARQASTTTTKPSPESSSPNDFSMKHKMKTCCKSAGSLDFEKYKEVMYDCFDETTRKISITDRDPLAMELFSCSRANVLQMIYLCSVQCVGVKLQLFNEEGTPRPENMKRLAKEDILTVDWLRRIADRTIDTCVRSLNNTLLSSPDTGDTKCYSSMFELKHCLWVEMEKNCPEADRKTDTPYCKRVQASLDKQRDA